MNDLISRQALMKEFSNFVRDSNNSDYARAPTWNDAVSLVESMPSARIDRLTDDDFETIRIHLNAQKENLCNQQRWKEAEEYQRIIDRFMAFASAEPERKKGKWIKRGGLYQCSACEDFFVVPTPCCPNCGADLREEKNDE